MQIKKILKLAIALMIIISSTGCFKKEWTNAEKYILERQSTSMLKFKQPKDPEKFKKCFINYILDNYSGKEYMNSGTSAASLAIIECMN